MRDALRSVARAQARVRSWMLRGVLACLTGGLYGASAPASDFATDDVTISLPPMLVEERLTPLRWRYLQMPGVEVLSLWDDAVTREFFRRYHRLEQVLHLLVPARFQGQSSVPEIEILFNEDLSRARSQEIMQEMLRRDKAASGAVGTVSRSDSQSAGLAPWLQRRVYFLPNLRLFDIDASAVFVATRESDPELAEFTFVADRIRYLLLRRVPALPDWFVAGTVGLYEQATLRTDGISFAPATWISEAETRALAAEENRPRTLWPMQELLAMHQSNADAEGIEPAAIWRSQCALFIRWAVLEDDGARKAALWTFVERLDHEPMSEALFRECFGLGFSDVRDRLSDYLPAAVVRGGQLRAPKLLDPPELKPRAATVVEIARLRGEWERMQINYVKRRFPELTEKYVDQTRHTLQSAYARGERDPRLLAVIGLTECDAGNGSGARAYLEAAAHAGVLRPRVYVELARLRLAEVVGEAVAGPLSPAQVAWVLEPLRMLRTMEPPLPEACAILAEVLGKSAEAPSREELAWLNEGVARLARISPLVLRAIHLNAANGFPVAALELARAGERAAVEPEMRAIFARVLAQLRKVAPAG